MLAAPSWPHAFWQSCARGRLGVLSKDANRPSPTTKLLAGMPTSEAAAERVFSALAVTVTAIREGH